MVTLGCITKRLEVRQGNRQNTLNLPLLSRSLILLIHETPFTMPGEVIDRPNPQPLPSHIDDAVDRLEVKLQQMTLDQPACDALCKFRRAACFIAAGKSSLCCRQFIANRRQE